MILKIQKRYGFKFYIEYMKNIRPYKEMNSFDDSRFYGECLSVFDVIGHLSQSEADELY